MKATFLIPDELCCEVKAETAREGRSVREVTILLFEEWLNKKKQNALHANPVDWLSFQPPLAGPVQDPDADHATHAMRETITRKWNEKA